MEHPGVRHLRWLVWSRYCPRNLCLLEVQRVQAEFDFSRRVIIASSLFSFIIFRTKVYLCNHLYSLGAIKGNNMHDLSGKKVSLSPWLLHIYSISLKDSPSTLPLPFLLFFPSACSVFSLMFISLAQSCCLFSFLVRNSIMTRVIERHSPKPRLMKQNMTLLTPRGWGSGNSKFSFTKRSMW